MKIILTVKIECETDGETDFQAVEAQSMAILDEINIPGVIDPCGEMEEDDDGWLLLVNSAEIGMEIA